MRKYEEKCERLRGSNRTFMELKFKDYWNEQHDKTSSNRTFMELKFDKAMASDYLNAGSNRTFMELK